MRTVTVILLFSLVSAFSLEWAMTDEQRTKASIAVFTGRVNSTEFVRELDSGALWRAVIKITKVNKSDGTLMTNAVVYYEQTFVGRSGEHGIRTHGRVCPAYPNIMVSQEMKLWCTGSTIAGHTKVLFIPS